MNKVLISTLCSGREYVKFLIGFLLLLMIRSTSFYIQCFLLIYFVKSLPCIVHHCETRE